MGLIALRIFLYALLLSASALVVFWDAAHLQSAEESYTEMGQELLLLLMVIIGSLTAKKFKQYRIFILFLVAFSAVFFIREFNNYLSDNFFDGAWQTAALAVLLPSVYFLFKNRNQLKNEALELKESAPFALIMMGGLQLIVFSRIYGNKQIWKDFMGEQYIRLIKEVSEESIELMAYAVIFVGFVELIFLVRSKEKT